MDNPGGFPDGRSAPTDGAWSQSERVDSLTEIVEVRPHEVAKLLERRRRVDVHHLMAVRGQLADNCPARLPLPPATIALFIRSARQNVVKQFPSRSKSRYAARHIGPLERSNLISGEFQRKGGHRILQVLRLRCTDDR